jgi:MFS family permease
MNLAWSSAFFTYYMVGFYVKYIPGDIFTNVILSSLSEASACFLSGCVANLIGTKHTLILSFLIGGVFGLILSLTPPTYMGVILTCLILTKFGVSSALSLCFLVTSEYFPMEYCSTVFGACNIMARITSILAPLIAELSPPTPMICYVIFCGLSVMAVFMLDKKKKDVVVGEGGGGDYRDIFNEDNMEFFEEHRDNDNHKFYKALEI